MGKNKNVLVLFSGGIDSTSCIFWYKKLKYNVTGLFVDFGQKAANQEKKSVLSLSKKMKIKTITIKSGIKSLANDGYIQGRNLFLLSQALMVVPFSKGIVSMGLHSETIYSDCSIDFIDKTQELYDLYTDGNIVIDCPFIKLNKLDVCNYFKKSKISLDLTYSCEMGKPKACGKCRSCLDIKKAFYE